ncbi:MAG: peptide chain release factor 2 [Bacilli bacterium]|nr:peptide chain release factor 2 [Bacilli bacterium]
MIYGGLFDPTEKQKRIATLESIMKEDNFWNDKKKSEEIISEYNYLKKLLEETNVLKEEIEFHYDNIKNSKEENTDLIQFAIEEHEGFKTKLEDLELQILLNGTYDKNDAVLEIHSGAGGTEACDWANMLYRMYTRWCEKQNYKIEIIDKQEGTETGIKSISIIVKGHNAFGYLQGEKGIHRLVRISPFDSNSRRHTSFAAVDITPVIEENTEFNIDENDLRIDVYRSSGPGGQGVNTTDSAVRITHIPTKTVVTCQSERSQIQNKERCMQILKSKLLKIQQDKKEEEMRNIKGEQKEINFGSQIRSYIMCPYTLVKDHRTNAEDVNVNKVLDGEIDKFIKEYLKEK